MSTINFCSNPVTKVTPEITKGAKQVASEMKPFPELCQEAKKCETNIVKPYVSPYTPYQNPRIEKVNKQLAEVAAEKTYPPAPFN